MPATANMIMKRNVDALLKARRQTRRELAQWCRRSDAWIAKIMAEGQREFTMKYYDRIADFFGLSVYQLFQPGISPLTERRKGHERRTGADRRISAKHSEASTPIRQIDITPQEEAWLAELRAMRYEDVVRLRDWIATRKGNTT